MRRAVIDVGTNSVKLLVAAIENRVVLPLWEESQQTRLGQGFYNDHWLRPEAIAETAQAVARFAEIAREWNARPVRVIATSAARDATNQSELLGAIERESGLSVNVISGQQEAEWAYAGVRTDPAFAGRSLLIMDVGGGSTEFIVGDGLHPDFRQSFPIGTVRFLELMPLSDPPMLSEWERCRDVLREILKAQVRPAVQSHLGLINPDALAVVGTGGSTTLLAAMNLKLTTFDRESIEKTNLQFGTIQALRAQLWSLSLNQRKELPGLPPNRADVILFGVGIVEQVMTEFGFESLSVSTRGLRFGALIADMISR